MFGETSSLNLAIQNLHLYNKLASQTWSVTNFSIPPAKQNPIPPSFFHFRI